MHQLEFAALILVSPLLGNICFAGRIEQLGERRCWNGVSNFEEPTVTETAVTKDACCAHYVLGLSDIHYTVADGLFKELIYENETNFCRFDHSNNVFSCCCIENLCNTQSFLQWHWNAFFEKIANRPFVQFIPLLTFGIVGVVIGLLTYMTLDCCVIQPHNGHFRIEMSPDYCVNMRGVKVLPYLTKGEAKMVLKQIQYARSIEASPPKELKKRPEVIGVYTYSTTATVTNRELGAVPIPLPTVTGIERYIQILTRMIEVGPRECKFEPALLLDIIESAENVFKTECSLLEVPVPCQVYGDIHGQYSDLLRWFHLNGWPPTTRCCFLGDYVDRGRHSIEVIIFLFLLKIVMPHDVFICRGNHEDPNINRVYSFFAELEARVGNTNGIHEKVFARFMQCFCHIPLAALIGKKVLGMHGGLSPKLTHLDDIRNIQRPVVISNGELACDLVWSDPDRRTQAYDPNYKRDKINGIGYLFGTRQVLDASKKLGIDLIVRGHQAPMAGYELFGQKLITIFSAPGYRTSSDLETNYGASLHIDERGKMIITRIGVDNQVRLLRELQKLDKGEPYTNMDKLILKPKREDDDGTY